MIVMYHELSVVLTVLAGVLGLAIGSSLNVVIWRLPRGESLSHPPSACPECGHAIRWFDNVPVVSWLVLRAKCRDCGTPISARYPLVESVTAILFALVAWWSLTGGLPTKSVLATSLGAIAFLYLAAVTVALTLIDIDTHRLPNKLVLPSYIVGIVLLAAASIVDGDWGSLVRALAGMAILFAAYFAMFFAYPKGMGFGDVKLAGVIGLYLAWLGWGELAVGAFAAFVLGGIFSIALLALSKADRKTGIPFGPWMIAGLWVGTFLGGIIAREYLLLFGLGM